MPSRTPRQTTGSVLLDKFGLTMTLAQVHTKFFPNISIRTLQNKKSAQPLPP